MKSISTPLFETLVSLGEKFIPQALELGSRRDNHTFFQKELDEAIEKSWLEKAQKLAPKIGRKLTDDELWGFFKKGASCLAVNYDIASAALELLPKGKRNHGYKLIIKKAVKEGRFDVAQHAAEKLGRPLDVAEVECLAALAIEDGSFYALEQVLPCLGRELKVSEKRKMLAANIHSGWLSGADQAAKLLGRRLSTSELEKLLRYQLERCHSHSAHETVLRLPKKKRYKWLTRILAKYVHSTKCEDTRLDLAQEAAKMIGRELTIQEIHQILLNHLKFKGPHYEAHQVAEYLIQRIRASK